MNIAVDLRSLQSGSVSGVENYTLNLLDALLAMDKKNSYKLFYNRFTGDPVLPAHKIGDFQYVNSKIISTSYPNRLLNLALLLKLTNLEKLIGDLDVLFMPNLNQFNISPSAKLAVTVHDLSPVVTPEFYDFKRNLWHRLLHFKRSFERADLIFAVSEYTKLDLMRLFNVPEQKIKVVHPGIDVKTYQPNIEVAKLRRARNIYGLPGDYILFLNTIEPRKNLSGLVKAFELLGRDGSRPVPTSDPHLLIVGRPGWKHRKIFNEIKQSRKSAKIKYIGYVPEEDKPLIIKMAKMLVYPSFYEGFGFQPLEAMAMGVPTIVSQVTSLPEVVNAASLMVNPYNISDLARAMQSLLADQVLKIQLISKGILQVNNYSWQKTAAGILEGLNSL